MQEYIIAVSNMSENVDGYKYKKSRLLSLTWDDHTSSSFVTRT